MEEYAREPCPWRIVDDCGGAFAMGAIGGTVFHSIKGKNVGALWVEIDHAFVVQFS